VAAQRTNRPRTPLQPNSPICLVDDFRLEFRPRFRQRVFLAMVGLSMGPAVSSGRPDVAHEVDSLRDA
jgi:hypothetical protein